MSYANKQRWNVPQGWLRRHTICAAGMCGFKQQDDDTHVWGECTRCGRVAGVVSRTDLRRHSALSSKGNKE